MYIWNVDQTRVIIELIKTIAPNITIILGGPEVSYEWERQPIVGLADYLVTGEAEVTLPILCRQILTGEPPEKKVHIGVLPVVTELKLPYYLYNDEDVQHRIMYVEASRGCPFKCQFCLSSLDKVRNLIRPNVLGF